MPQDYLHILRSALGLENTSIESIVYDQVMHYAFIHGTPALVAERLLRPDLSALLTPDQRQQLKGICAQSMMQWERLRHVLVCSTRALEEAGVQPVLLKGFGLATLYPTPYLRQWGDLDIYVGPEQYHAAADVLRKTYPDARHHDEEWEELKHYCFILSDGNIIEMHRRTMALVSRRDQRCVDTLEDEAMRHTETMDIEGLTVNIPEAKFNILFVFMHAWEHFYETGAGCKQLADLALLLSQPHPEDLDKYLEKPLRKLYLFKPWLLIGYMMVHAFGLKPGQVPLYKETRWVKKHGQRLYDKIIEEGLARPPKRKENRYTARDKAMKMPIIQRKLLTLRLRIEHEMSMSPYVLSYSLHRLWAMIIKGIRRTLHGSKMIKY